MANNQGALAQGCMDTALPIDASSEAFEFLTFGLTRNLQFAHSNGLRGQRARVDHRVAQTAHRVSGPLTLNPSVTELDRLWARMIGGTTAGGITIIADTIPQFYICADKVGTIETFSKCVVSSWSISGQSGQPLLLTLNIEAEKSDDTTTAAYPAITIDTEDMFVMSDVVANVAGSSRSFSSFSLNGNNMCDTERQLNSLYRSEIPAQDSEITLDLTMPQNGNTALRDGTAAGVAGSIVISDGATTYTFTTGKMIAMNPATEAVNSKTEIMTPLQYSFYESGATPQLTITKT